ncbi:MAG: hypothetical protein LKM40_00560 [Mageeibacillus sp.]|nr:hypothetical protein [Mageeibacillus sp.]
MSIWGLLYSLIIGPLQLLFEIIFSQVNKVTSNPGLTVIIESLLLNILLYPLYSQADRIQEAATAKEKAMKPMVEHIRHHFKGDERVMMLQAYYRENSYSPLSIISTSLPVLLQIPFFPCRIQYAVEQYPSGRCFVWSDCESVPAGRSRQNRRARV